MLFYNITIIVLEDKWYRIHYWGKSIRAGTFTTYSLHGFPQGFPDIVLCIFAAPTNSTATADYSRHQMTEMREFRGVKNILSTKVIHWRWKFKTRNCVNEFGGKPPSIFVFNTFQMRLPQRYLVHCHLTQNIMGSTGSMSLDAIFEGFQKTASNKVECTGGSSGPFGGQSWRRGPNLPPFSSFSTDLGHCILKLLNFDIYFLFYVEFLRFLDVFLGGQTGHFRPWGGGWP